MFFGDRILTPRLQLRKIIEEDLPLFVEWSNSPVAHGKYLSPDLISEDAGREQYRSGAYWSENNKVFMVSTRNGKQQNIGTLHYWLRAEQQECAIIAVKISDPRERNKGYGTEAQKYLIMQLFDRVKVTQVEMYTDHNNVSQQHCLKKLGFELVDSLSYNDHDVFRFGHLYRLHKTRYNTIPYYQYHYEG